MPPKSSKTAITRFSKPSSKRGVRAAGDLVGFEKHTLTHDPEKSRHIAGVKKHAGTGTIITMSPSRLHAVGWEK